MKIVLLLFAALFVGRLNAQTSSPVFQIGGGVNYYYGVNGGSSGSFAFERDRLGFEFNAMLGLQTYTPEKQPKSIFGFFGKSGFISHESVEYSFDDQSFAYTIDSLNTNADFMELEIGILARHSFRLSFGYGWLNFYDQTHSLQTLNYYCATAGFSIPAGNLKWNILLTAMQGRDFNTLTFRPSTGLVIHLD